MDDRTAWRTYYTEKRVGQQWKQLDLLSALPVRRVLEVGPHLGFVTALLHNMGYEVTTLDIGRPDFERPEVPHLEADLRTLSQETVSGFDAILCCECLEHLPWEDSVAALRAFREGEARYLILSVPYEGFQIGFSFYFNPFTWRRTFFVKKFRRFKRFRPGADPMGHKWEVGYRGYPLRRWEEAIRAAGWTIRQRAFTSGCRSVFHLCER